MVAIGQEADSKNDTLGKCCNKDHKLDFLDLDVALGWNVVTNRPDGMSTKFFRSREFLVGLRYRYTPRKALQTYSAGLWVKWNRYALSDKMFYKNTDNVIELTTFDANYSSTRSCINIFSLSVPVFFTQKLGRNSDWSVTLGPVVNFNLRGRINNEYEIGQDSYDINTKGIEYRPVTVDLMGMLKYKDVSIYCKYSPMRVLKKNMGPQFRAVSFGIFL